MKSRWWWIGTARERSQTNGMHDLSEPTSSGSRPVVVARQLGAELAHPSADLVGVEEDLADSLVELGQRAQDAFRSP